MKVFNVSEAIPSPTITLPLVSEKFSLKITSHEPKSDHFESKGITEIFFECSGDAVYDVQQALDTSVCGESIFQIFCEWCVEVTS